MSYGQPCSRTTAGPSRGPSSSYPTSRTPASTCWSDIGGPRFERPQNRTGPADRTSLVLPGRADKSHKRARFCHPDRMADLHLSANADADALLSRDPLALVIGMVL